MLKTVEYTKRRFFKAKIVSALLPLLLVLVVQSGYGEYRFEWHVDMTLHEQYDDNLFLSPSAEEEEYITTLSPGGQILLETRTSAINLDYHLNPTFYANNPELDFLGHLANFSAHKTLWRHLTLRVEDQFVRSQELRQARFRDGEVFLRPVGGDEEPVVDPTAFLTDTEYDLSVFVRNTLTASAEWRYGSDDRVRLSYVNIRLENEAETIPDEIADSYVLLLEHWFGPGYGFLFDFGYLMYRSPDVSDYEGQNANLTFTRRFTPRTSAFFQAGFLNRILEEDEATDYQGYRGNIGLTHDISPRVSARTRGGYFFRDPEEGEEGSVMDGEIALTLRWFQIEGTPYFRGGYVRDPEFAEFWSMGGGLSYQATRRITLGINFSYDTYYFQGPDLESWQGSAEMTFLPFEWLTTSLNVSHRERTESQQGAEYRNNRVLLRLTARY